MGGPDRQPDEAAQRQEGQERQKDDRQNHETGDAKGQMLQVPLQRLLVRIVTNARAGTAA